MKMISVDFGETRTGLASCDEMEMLATPLCLITEKNFNRTAQLTADKAIKEGAKLIVVGLPRRTDGKEGEREKRCIKFAEIVTKISHIPHVMWNEWNTTVSSAYYMNMTNTRGKKRKAELDVASATIILQSYMDYRKNMKERENNV